MAKSLLSETNKESHWEPGFFISLNILAAFSGVVWCHTEVGLGRIDFRLGWVIWLRPGASEGFPVLNRGWVLSTKIRSANSRSY